VEFNDGAFPDTSVNVADIQCLFFCYMKADVYKVLCISYCILLSHGRSSTNQALKSNSVGVMWFTVEALTLGDFTFWISLLPRPKLNLSWAIKFGLSPDYGLAERTFWTSPWLIQKISVWSLNLSPKFRLTKLSNNDMSCENISLFECIGRLQSHCYWYCN